MRYMKIVLCLLLMSTAVLLPCLADTHQVKQKDKNVALNNQIDFNDEEIAVPETVVVIGKWTRMNSKTYTPPKKRKFKLFESRPTHVDIWHNPAGISPARLVDTETGVQVRDIYDNTAVAVFPLRCEGNLKRAGGGGGGGGAPEPLVAHWSAKTGDIVVEILYPFDENKDGKINDATNEFCYNNAEVGVLSFTCVAKHPGTGDPEKLRWYIDDIGTIRGKWNPHAPGNEYVGKGRVSTVTFTGLPMNNSDFGKKNILLRYLGSTKYDTEDIEVFFDPIAQNNPGPEPDDIPSNLNRRNVVIKGNN